MAFLKPGLHTPSSSLKAPPLPRRALLLSGAGLICAAGLAQLLTPRHLDLVEAPKLEEAIPEAFSTWRATKSALIQAELSVNDRGQRNLNSPYDQTLSRTYIDQEGHHIMLALAWGKVQRQEVKIHRPELCYPAQGLHVLSLTSASLTGIGDTMQPVVGKRMLSQGMGRLEAVTYWIRIGNSYSDDAWSTRLHILKEGLQGRIPDGILVRASVIVPSEQDADAAYPMLEQFLTDLVKFTPPSARSLLVK